MVANQWPRFNPNFMQSLAGTKFQGRWLKVHLRTVANPTGMQFGPTSLAPGVGLPSLHWSALGLSHGCIGQTLGTRLGIALSREAHGCAPTLVLLPSHLLNTTLSRQPKSASAFRGRLWARSGIFDQCLNYGGCSSQFQTCHASQSGCPPAQFGVYPMLLAIQLKQLNVDDKRKCNSVSWELGCCYAKAWLRCQSLLSCESL